MKTKRPGELPGLFSSVPQTVQFSNSFYQNLHDIYNLKEPLINEGLVDNQALSSAISRKQINSLVPLGN